MRTSSSANALSVAPVQAWTTAEFARTQSPSAGSFSIEPLANGVRYTFVFGGMANKDPRKHGLRLALRSLTDLHADSCKKKNGRWGADKSCFARLDRSLCPGRTCRTYPDLSAVVQDDEGGRDNRTQPGVLIPGYVYITNPP